MTTSADSEPSTIPAISTGACVAELPAPRSTVSVYRHYLVERQSDGNLWELGRGGMGVTYKAQDTNLHIPVALKIIGPQCFGNELSQQRFVREARLAAQIHHPNVAAIYHLDNQDGEFFYSMEFIDGITAAAWVNRAGPMSVERALDVCMQVARALTAADRLNLAHRDIKPANIMLVPDPVNSERVIVKLIDFGLARSFSSEAGPGVTTCGFVGTPQFASPEQAENFELDIRSDIYSLGCTLWYLLLGEAPFAGSAARVIAQHLTSPPPWERLVHFPDSIRALLRRMLAKNPKERPQNPVELHAEICSCRENLRAVTPTSAFPSAWLKIKPHLPQNFAPRALRPWAVAAGVMVITGAWVILGSREGTGTVLASSGAVTSSSVNVGVIPGLAPISLDQADEVPKAEAALAGSDTTVDKSFLEAESPPPSVAVSTEAVLSEPQAAEFLLQPPVADSSQALDLKSQSAVSLSLSGLAEREQKDEKATAQVTKKSVSRGTQKRRSREAPFKPLDGIGRSVRGFVQRIF